MGGLRLQMVKHHFSKNDPKIIRLKERKINNAEGDSLQDSNPQEVKYSSSVHIWIIWGELKIEIQERYMKSVNAFLPSDYWGYPDWIVIFISGGLHETIYLETVILFEHPPKHGSDYSIIITESKSYGCVKRNFESGYDLQLSIKWYWQRGILAVL